MDLKYSPSKKLKKNDKDMKHLKKFENWSNTIEAKPLDNIIMDSDMMEIIIDNFKINYISSYKNGELSGEEIIDLLAENINDRTTKNALNNLTSKEKEELMDYFMEWHFYDTSE